MASPLNVAISNTVILLFGPKGAGKTHIGTLLETSNPSHIHFVRVESIFLRLQEQHKDAAMSKLAEWCYQEVAEEVKTVLNSDKGVAILEVTGVAPQLPSLLETLKERHSVKYVKISTPLETCLQRVQERDASQQIAVSEERVMHINRLALEVEYPWDLIVDNGSLRSDKEILQLFADVLK